jgi:hypothetical protein
MRLHHDAILEVVSPMRTTLDIDDEVLSVLKDLARQQNVSIGKIVSKLVREAVLGGGGYRVEDRSPSLAGFKPFPSRGKLVSNATVEALRERDGI